MRGLFVVDVATGATQRVLRAESDPWNPEWSPDGDRILYHVALPVSDAGTAGLAVVNSFQLRILDLDTGEITVVAGSKEDSAFDGSWLSPDRIVFMRGIDHSPAGVDHFELWTVELATGSRERLLNVGEASWAWEASVSPDRRRIAYVKSVDGDDRVFVLDLGTGRTRQTTSAWYPIWLDDGTLFVQRKPDPDADSTSP
jgi:Tol biopolymer transport system component